MGGGCKDDHLYAYYPDTNKWDTRHVNLFHYDYLFLY